jgi:hypothetical protein
MPERPRFVPTAPVPEWEPCVFDVAAGPDELELLQLAYEGLPDFPHRLTYLYNQVVLPADRHTQPDPSHHVGSTLAYRITKEWPDPKHAIRALSEFKETTLTTNQSYEMQHPNHILMHIVYGRRYLEYLEHLANQAEASA